MDKPRIKGHLVAEVVGSELVFLLAEDRHYLVRGAASARVVDHLDGEHSVPVIAGELSACQSLPETLFAVSKFQQLRHVADGPSALPPGPTAYWEALGVDAGQAASVIEKAVVTVLALGQADPAPVLAALAELGIRTTSATLQQVVTDQVPETAANPLTLVVTDDYLNPDLAEVNRAMLAQKQRWMLAKTVGYLSWIGPVLTPGVTGCWTCLAQRLEGNRQVERYLQRKNPQIAGRVTSRAQLPTSVAAAAALAAQELAKSLLDVGSLDGLLVTVDQRNLSTDRHELIRQPQCPSCGDPDIRLARDPRIDLAARTATFTVDGGSRAQTPHATFDRLGKHISPLLGAVTSLTRLNDTDNGLTYSFSAGHNFAMPGDDLAMLRRNLRGQSGGKGRSEIQAKVSGLCEAIERFSGVWRADVPVERHAYADLGTRRSIHPRQLLLFSDDQYANRREWNRGTGRLHVVPEPFDESRPIDWTQAWSMTNDEPVLVPAGYVWFGHPDLGDHFYCYSDANGNAAGNNLEEAVLQGFCELVERDAVAAWWYNRTRLPEVDLDSLGETYVQTLRDYYASIDRDIWVLDMTTDLGVPAFAALSHRSGGPAEDILLGFGAHVDPHIAIMRSLTELNQFLPAVVKRNPDGSTAYWEDDNETVQWWLTATLEAQPWLLPDPDVTPRTVGEMPSLATGDLRADINACVDRLREAGLEMLVVDQTRPEIELSVAKVMVPGMRHFWRRLAPGRLYDVPVTQGRLAEPRREDELNPVSVFF